VNYAAAQAYLLGTVNETASRREPHRLDRMRAFLAALENPQDAYPTIHVGGTSGKGSTCTMLASILTASGKRTGLHTKPHLRSMTERARVDGRNVPEERFAELLDEMMPVMDSIAHEHGRPSYYETLLALAFLYFARERVDAAVIEVGIGGRLDGTNVLIPRVSAITSIGLDHTEILGDTLEAIAADKAGIAKPGVPLVYAVDDAGPRAVIEAECARAGAPAVSVLDCTSIVERSANPYSQEFELTSPGGVYRIALPAIGRFQQRNSATAVLALEQLGPDLRPSRENVEQGLATLALPGRMEFFPSHPGVLFDVAHNPEKAAKLAQALLQIFPERRFSFVIAVGESKDAHRILESLKALPANFIFTAFRTQGRTATKPARLASVAESMGLWGRVIGDPVEALAVARRNASADDVVVVTGSTFVVAELRDWWMENVVRNDPADRFAH
jgi:dihydrofolate synthase/folylpolyglutamate synthase